MNNLALPGIITGDILSHQLQRQLFVTQLQTGPAHEQTVIFIMRILIQKKDSGLYFRDIEDWTSSSVHAMDFLSSTRAIEFCVANKINGVHLVLKFEEEHHEIVLPLGKDKSSRSDTDLNF